MTTQKITVEAAISQPIAAVWRAYTSPESITQWNFASDDWCCPSAETDLRVGGAHKVRMEAKDGSFGFDFEAINEELVPEELLDLALADGRRSRTTFAPIDGGTKVTTTFDAETQNPIDMQRDGWQAILNNFKAYVEG